MLLIQEFAVGFDLKSMWEQFSVGSFLWRVLIVVAVIIWALRKIRKERPHPA